jgi:hypothetical protein
VGCRSSADQHRLHLGGAAMMGPVSQQIALMVMVCGVLAFVLGKCVGA